MNTPIALNSDINIPEKLPSLVSVLKSIDNDGFAVADIGLVVPKLPISRYKANVHKKDLASYPYSKVLIARNHFVDGMGYIYCFGGECCEDNGMPVVRYGLLQVLYPTDKNAKLIQGELTFNAHIMGTDTYNLLLDIRKFLDSSVDVVIVCTEQNYQKISFIPTKETQWSKVLKPEEMEEKCTSLFKFLPGIMGNKISRTDYLSKRNLASSYTVEPFTVQNEQKFSSGMDFSHLVKK